MPRVRYLVLNEEILMILIMLTHKALCRDNWGHIK